WYGAELDARAVGQATGARRGRRAGDVGARGVGALPREVARTVVLRLTVRAGAINPRAAGAGRRLRAACEAARAIGALPCSGKARAGGGGLLGARAVRVAASSSWRRAGP